ncbi:unnamed protein product [Effrenium voratum]|uniref:Uncharacterized protein n=1 Tax=Effrenium voratum TaxID=2562239 RepID=A0AA36IEB8_9DINO|nr:unnamed protein product [Effrenium voratum]
MDFDELEEVEGDASAQKSAADEKAAADRAAAAEKLSAERRAMLKKEEPQANGANGASANGAPPAPAPAPAAPKLPLWEVVGGADKGGILVRDGESTSSTQLADRLSTGARVEQLELKGQRLHYRLSSGTGPAEGWISIALSGKDLAVPIREHVAVLKRDTEPRCAAELQKPPVGWTPVSMPQLQEKHMKVAPGIIYMIDFPFNAELLQKMGPAWLTKAFHAAGSIPKDNKVKTLKNIKEYIGGGNCAKLIFDVEYEVPAPDLHTQLFAKIPFPLAGNTLSDRMASSVMQSGSELGEINAQRLLESRLPFSVPRFYFGDVSNETSNWILITERIPFDQKDGDRKVDPAYDKMKDWELKGTMEEYYFLLTRYGAMMAGMDKAEKLAPRSTMDSFFPPASLRPKEMWGMKAESTGIGEKEFAMKIKMGADFVGTTGKALFPAVCSTPAFLQKYKKILAISNAYTAEMNWWCNRNPDYIAWSHGNLNVDNVFFFRDADGKLDLGVLDWGGARTDSMGWKLWWWLYCCEYDFLNANLDAMLDCFIKEYEAYGGPKLDRAELRWQFTLSALQQGVGLLGAVPQIYKMCKKTEFATITDRKDPRIAKNIDGKNTLRIYIGTFINICNMIKDWDIETQLHHWVKEVCAATGIPEKKVTVE